MPVSRLRKKPSEREIDCAFCGGVGKDPFNLLSEFAKCQVCGGTGKVNIIEPAIKCTFCKGTGVYPYNARVTCYICDGSGMVTVKGRSKPCQECRGTGKSASSEIGLPCTKCGGKAFISVK